MYYILYNTWHGILLKVNPVQFLLPFRNIFRILKHFKNFSGIFLMTELINKQNKLVAMAKLQVFIYGCSFLNNFIVIAIEIS
jgi:hypothetical protein